MDEHGSTGPASTNARLRELDNAHWNMLRKIMVVETKRSLAFHLRSQRQSWCPRCQVVHDEVHSFYLNYN